MKPKKELLKECAQILQTKKVSEWYEQNMKGKPQYETINDLERAIKNGELSIREALAICLIVGVQWYERF